MSVAVQLLETFPPAKSLLEMHHFSGGTSGSCCTPESTVGGSNFGSTDKGKVLGLAGAWRGAAAGTGFGLIPPLAEIKQKSLSSKSLLSLGECWAPGAVQLRRHRLTRAGVKVALSPT